jgi:hypothetical protein
MTSSVSKTCIFRVRAISRDLQSARKERFEVHELIEEIVRIEAVRPVETR